MTGFLYPGQVIDKRITFASTVTGDPATAIIRVNSVAYGDEIEGTHVPGSTTGDTWRFIATVPEIDDPDVVIGKYIVIEAYGNQDGVIQQIIIAEGTLVELTENSGSWPLTDQQTENLIEQLGLDNEPFVPEPIVVPPPENDDLSGGYGHTYDENEELVGDVEVNFQLIRGPGTEALILSTAVRTITSNEDAEIIGYFRKGATYRAWTDNIQQHVVFEVPNTDTFALPEIIRW